MSKYIGVIAAPINQTSAYPSPVTESLSRRELEVLH